MNGDERISPLGRFLPTPLERMLERIYAAALRRRNARFDATAPMRLRWPVISIGNLSVGGAGKTPLAIELVRLLAGHGVQADVLTRGYGRSSRRAEGVDPEGRAERYGDEPLLISRATGAAVFVGADRYAAGLLAESGGAGGARRVHLLDDGFQHRRLARDVDIVLVHPADLDDRLLPAGRLREPPAALRRADIVVLRSEDAALEPRLREYAAGESIYWKVLRRVSYPVEAKKTLAFCAIARPREFLHALEALGVRVAERMIYRDHHRYTAADAEKMAALCRRSGCEEMATTEKDAVKLDRPLRQILERAAPLKVAQLTLEIQEDATSVQGLIHRLPFPPL